MNVFSLIKINFKYFRKATLEDCYKIQQCITRLSEIVTALDIDEADEGKREIQANFIGPLIVKYFKFTLLFLQKFSF